MRLLVNVFIMTRRKLSNEDKMRIQILRTQGLWVKAINASSPDKVCSLGTL